MLERFFKPSLPVKHVSDSIGCIPIVRVELESLLEALQGLGQPVEIDKNLAKAGPQFSVVGRELERLIERLERLFKPALALQRASESRKIFRLGILPNGPGDPLDSKIRLFRMEEQQTHQMQGVGMSGICRQHVLTANPRLELPSGLEMQKPGAIKRIGGGCVDTAQRLLGIFELRSGVRCGSSTDFEADRCLAVDDSANPGKLSPGIEPRLSSTGFVWPDT